MYNSTASLLLKWEESIYIKICLLREHFIGFIIYYDSVNTFSYNRSAFPHR
jgi:hypothetical protein